MYVCDIHVEVNLIRKELGVMQKTHKREAILKPINHTVAGVSDDIEDAKHQVVKPQDFQHGIHEDNYKT